MRFNAFTAKFVRKTVLILLIFVTVMFTFSCSNNTTEFTVVIQDSGASSVTSESIESLKQALLVRLGAFYVNSDNVEFSENGANSLTVRVNSQALSHDELSVIVSNDIITFRDSGGKVFMDNSDIEAVAIDFDLENSKGENGCYIKITLTDKGSDAFLSQSRITAALTDENDRFIGIFCGDEQVSAPKISSPVITNDIMLTGDDYTIASVSLLYQKLFCALNTLPMKVSLLE